MKIFIRIIILCTIITAVSSQTNNRNNNTFVSKFPESISLTACEGQYLD